MLMIDLRSFYGGVGTNQKLFKPYNRVRDNQCGLVREIVLEWSNLARTIVPAPPGWLLKGLSFSPLCLSCLVGLRPVILESPWNGSMVITRRAYYQNQKIPSH